MGKKVIWSFDYDGCLSNQEFFDRKDQPNAIIQANQQFLDNTVVESARDAQEVIILCGSNRQDAYTDISNAFYKENRSAITEIQKVANYIQQKLAVIRVVNNPVLLADIASGKAHGTTAREITTDYLDNLGNPSAKGKKYLKDMHKSVNAEAGSNVALGTFDNLQHFNSTNATTKIAADESKVLLLYTQMHLLASQNPDDELKFHFADDLDEIANNAQKYFAENPYLIPKNMTLHVHHYAKYGNANVTAVVGQPIVGTDAINHHYQHTYNAVVKAAFSGEVAACIDKEKLKAALPEAPALANQIIKQAAEKIENRGTVLFALVFFASGLLAGIANHLTRNPTAKGWDLLKDGDFAIKSIVTSLFSNFSFAGLGDIVVPIILNGIKASLKTELENQDIDVNNLTAGEMAAFIELNNAKLIKSAIKGYFGGAITFSLFPYVHTIISEAIKAAFVSSEERMPEGAQLLANGLTGLSVVALFQLSKIATALLEWCVQNDATLSESLKAALFPPKMWAQMTPAIFGMATGNMIAESIIAGFPGIPPVAQDVIRLFIPSILSPVCMLGATAVWNTIESHGSNIKSVGSSIKSCTSSAVSYFFSKCSSEPDLERRPLLQEVVIANAGSSSDLHYRQQRL